MTANSDRLARLARLGGTLAILTTAALAAGGPVTAEPDLVAPADFVAH